MVPNPLTLHPDKITSPPNQRSDAADGAIGVRGDVRVLADHRHGEPDDGRVAVRPRRGVLRRKVLR